MNGLDLALAGLAKEMQYAVLRPHYGRLFHIYDRGKPLCRRAKDGVGGDDLAQSRWAMCAKCKSNLRDRLIASVDADFDMRG